VPFPPPGCIAARRIPLNRRVSVASVARAPRRVPSHNGTRAKEDQIKETHPDPPCSCNQSPSAGTRHNPVLGIRPVNCRKLTCFHKRAQPHGQAEDRTTAKLAGTTGAASEGCPVKSPTGGLNQPRVGIGAVRAVKVVQRRQVRYSQILPKGLQGEAIRSTLNTSQGPIMEILVQTRGKFL
jgi:hypothetical protein